MVIEVLCKECAHKMVCQYTEDMHKFATAMRDQDEAHPYFKKSKGRKVSPEQRRLALDSLPHWATIGCRFFWNPPMESD